MPRGRWATGKHCFPGDYAKVVPRGGRHARPCVLAIGDTLRHGQGAAVSLPDVAKCRRLDEAKTNLIGVLSHELKMLLTSLRPAVDLSVQQKPGGLTRTHRESLGSARDDSERLLGIMHNRPDLARLAAGASSLKRQEIELAGLRDEIGREARSFLAPAGQRLVLDVAPTLSGVRFLLDSERLREVFMNLLTNASKYSPPGVVITLSASAEPGFVRFAVRAEGAGIPAESVASAFDWFYCAPGQAKSGAGLGLAIAREIVVAHGGSIACASEPGRGIEFYLRLPVSTGRGTGAGGGAQCFRRRRPGLRRCRARAGGAASARGGAAIRGGGARCWPGGR